MDEIQQPPYQAMHFHVTEGAQSQLLGGLPLLYVGISYHIARETLERAEAVYSQTQDLEQARSMIAEDDIGPDMLLRHIVDRGFQPVPDALLERFDTVDTDSGDMLVLLRVPCFPPIAIDEESSTGQAA
ncbi:MAG: hypothetical protein ACYC7E_20445 [Armatimonadota bacterium]